MKQILEDIKKYIDAKHATKTWVAGKDFVNYAGPHFDSNEYVAAAEALLNGWLVMGNKSLAFERQFPEQFGKTRGVLTNSGSSANLLMMTAMKSKRGYNFPAGTKVLMPIAGFPTTLNPTIQNNFTPVFCDIDEETLCIDLSKAQELVGPKTRAIIAMDYGCHLVDYERLRSFASHNKLRVIHDAAHSFGSKYKEKMIGSFSDICMFSFDPVKTITCIDGGALVVKTKEDVALLQEMRLIGMNQPASIMYGNKRAWTYGVSRIGFRYHLANLHAEIGRCQLSKISRIAATRRTSCALYEQLLCDVKEVKLPKQNFEEVVPFIYYIRVPQEIRDDLR